MITNGIAYYKRIKDIIPEVKDYYYITSIGEVINTSSRFDHEKFMGSNVANDGLVRVNLTTEYGRKTFVVDKLVAQAFVYNDNPMEKIYLRHKDRDLTNNNANNLEWITSSERVQIMYLNNLSDGKKRIYTNRKGEVIETEPRKQIFTTEEIHSICRMFEEGIFDYKVILENLDAHNLEKLGSGARKKFRECIRKIYKREAYVSISSQYNF